MFWRKKPYDRNEVLAAADHARARRRYRKAIEGYRKVLAVSPSDPAVLGKLAPLLVRTRQYGEALATFQLAAQEHVKAGFFDRAIAVYVLAAGAFPEEVKLWEEMAHLEELRGRRANAVNVLVKGSSCLGKRAKLRPRAIQLLEDALRIEPWHLDASLALAHLLAREGERRGAIARLEELATRVRGPALRRVRWALVCLAPNAGNVWRWIKALWRRR